LPELMTYTVTRTRGKATAQRSRAPTSPRYPISILVVDDHRDVREMYESYFRFMGTRVFLGRDGIDALQVIHHFQPDVVVLDLAMPRMTGWEVIQRLKGDAQTREIPIVVLSGQDARESRGDGP
jgi:chemosensory pili system protein ChpA (sensor histidine kinase/response regulator)